MTRTMTCGTRLGAVLAAVAASACVSPPATTGSQAAAPATAGLQAQVDLDIAAREHAAGDPAGAIAYYRIVLGLRTNLKEKAYVGLGDTLIDAGAADEAAENYTNALTMAPRDPLALIGMGNALVALNQPLAGEVDLRRGLAAVPSARGYRALATADDLLGHFQAAIDDCNNGIAQFPNDLGLHEDLGLSQALAGDFDDAVVTMQAVTSLPDATSRDRLNLALVLGLAGRDAEAAQAAQADLDPTSIQNNLLYYAELRALPANARAIALLRLKAAPSGVPVVTK